MTELSPEARRLLGEYDEGPSAGDEARVRAALEQTLGVTLPVATGAVAAHLAAVVGAAKTAGTGLAAGGASSAAAAATTSVLFKVVVVGLVGLTATGAVVATSWRPEPTRQVNSAAPPHAMSSPVPPALPAPSPVAPAASVEAPATRGASDPHLSRAREAPASREVPSDPEVAAEDPAPPLMDSATPTAVLPPEAPARCERSTELLFLDAAEADLNRDQPVAALAWLDSYYKRCPSGAWDARAWLIRTGSLCALGRTAEAATLIEWYAAEHSDSSVLGRAEQWCPPSLFPGAP